MNFRVTEGCYASGVVTVTTRRTVTYSDSTGTGLVRTWTTGPTGI